MLGLRWQRHRPPMFNFDIANKTLRSLLANGLTYRVPKFQRDDSGTQKE